MSKYKGKFVAQCMNGKMQLAMNNRGVLMPCCWCDHEHTLSTPLFKKMEKVSKVAENEEAPALVYEDLETASSVVRDLLTPDVEKIIIDSKRLFKKTQKYLSFFMQKIQFL